VPLGWLRALRHGLVPGNQHHIPLSRNQRGSRGATSSAVADALSCPADRVWAGTDLSIGAGCHCFIPPRSPCRCARSGRGWRAAVRWRDAALAAPIRVARPCGRCRNRTSTLVAGRWASVRCGAQLISSVAERPPSVRKLRQAPCGGGEVFLCHLVAAALTRKTARTVPSRPNAWRRV